MLKMLEMNMHMWVWTCCLRRAGQYENILRKLKMCSLGN